MKTVVVNNFTSLPASFIEVSQNSESPLYTRAKLKVFYIGETADHRLFTKAFSEKVIATIGYTPIVSNYNEEKRDFEGHSSQQQIYGIVDPMVEPTFIEEDKVTWAVCDVILYTERPDNTGTIAQKIIGQPQSLELKYDTVQYKINRDVSGKFKNLEYLDGKFIGVSVLSKDQQPAFTGSEFFSTNEFNERIEKIKEYCDTRGQDDMKITIPAFVEQSWSEKQNAVISELSKKYNDNVWVIDMYDAYCVYYVWDEQEKRSQLMRCDYTCEAIEGGNKVTFGEPEKVRVTYEKMSTSTEPVVPEPQVAEPVITEPVASVSVVAEVTKTERDTNDTNSQTSTVSSAFSDNDVAELNGYRQKAKEDLIRSYEDTIPGEELKKFTDTVNQYSFNDLENSLNALFVKFSKEKSKSSIQFGWAPEGSETTTQIDPNSDEYIAQQIRDRKRGKK